MASDLRLGEYGVGSIKVSEIGGQTGSENYTGAATGTRKFRLFGTTDALTARDTLLAGLGHPWNIRRWYNMPLVDLSWEWMKDSWIFTAKYDVRQPDIGGYTIGIDTGGGTFKQTAAYETAKFAASGQVAPDFGNSIDVQDGKINGADRIIPAMRINVRAKIAKAFISTPMAYAKLLAGFTGLTNSNSFLDCDAGELLFAGANGDIVGENPTLSYAFIYSPNLTNLVIGEITGIAKGGHDYLWFNFKSDKDTTNNISVKVPRAAYVSRIYKQGDFSAMKIGAPAP